VADRNLLRRVTGVLDEIGLDPRRLRLGVPASALPEASDVILALKNLGVQTMLDDFTFGPDDLRAVGEFSIGSVRVAGRLLEWQSATLVGLVQRVGVSVVVDGVSTASQAAWWRDAGAELATGDHFGAACPPEDVIARLG
jgi:EAL domain-containing protein (putative c-di-GMP-specific phosphodiesterase class I)